MTPTRTLELARERAARLLSDAFGVVFAAPRGETQTASEVTLVFNRPMVPLEPAESPPGVPAKLVVRGTDRSPPGEWRWMGTSALVFAPQARLPNATEYVVIVPAGTRALSGETLAEAYELAFATPRPRLERIDPDGGEEHLVPGQTFELRFDQPVDLREVERAATLTANAKRVPLRAGRPDPQNAKLVKLTPQSPLPLASSIELVLDASLHGTDGPLPMGAASRTTMQTYGPLRVGRTGCWSEPCRAGESVAVELTNAVSLADLRKHVRLEPAMRGNASSTSALPSVAVRWESETADESKRRSFWLRAPLRAGRSYQLTVTAGLRDEYGQVLARDATSTVAVRDLDPQVTVGLSGTVLEAAARPRVVPVSSVNLGEYDLLSGALDERAVAQALTTEEDGVAAYRGRFDRLAALPGVSLEHVRPSAARNATAVKNVSLDGLLAAHRGRGAVLLATRADRAYGGEVEAHVVSVTDLAITAKMSRFGSIVWVTRLSDGKPVSGATVAVVDRAGTIAEARTDADGVAAIARDRYEPADAGGVIDRKRIVVARLGDDWTWRTVGDTSGGGGSGVAFDASGGLQPVGMLFTDRGVYRPGETVKLQAIFRLPEARGTSTPAGRTVDVHAEDALGQGLFDAEAKLDDFGAATIDVPLPATAHLGSAGIRATMAGDGDGHERGAYTSVQLAAYKASETKAEVAAQAEQYTRGDEARFDVRGEYLFGAPMAGAAVHWTATRGPAWFVPPGAEGLVLDDEAYRADLRETSPRAQSLQTADGALDARGVLSARVSLALPGQRGPERVTLEAEVQDVSRQTTAARASAIVHPASFYVALAPPAQWFVSKGDVVRAQVSAVEPGGKRRAGAQVRVDLVRRTWSSALESNAEGSGHWVSKAVDQVVGSCDVTTEAAAVPCALAVRDPGFYLVHATSHDEKGREASAAYDLYAIDSQGGGDFGWAASDTSEVELVPDKKQYEVGDVARILVKNPVREAEALVTVERAGIYRQQRVHLSGATPTIRVPITEDLRPNAYVGVHLERGRTKEQPQRGADVGAPLFKSGVALLAVDPQSRRLQVAVTPSRKDARPGETVDADVVVTDGAGKPALAELTLWAVDEGVLMLTGYKTPDPLPVFTAPRPLAVFTMESRADLARIFRASLSQLGVDKGDDGGGGGEAMRADFRATAWFQPGVVTGTDGRAHVRIPLPDNLTTFRVMAVAVARDDRFGHGEAQVTTSRPLMLRPAVPRFLRAGDAMKAGVIVTTKGMPGTRVHVTLAVEGASVGGEAARDVDVPANGNVEVRWAIAAPRVGQAKLSFRARGGGESDAVEVTRRVDALTVLETAALYGETRETAGEKMGALDGIRDDVGGLDVRLASTALAGVGDGMDQLLEYPYGCTEQLTSRLVPLVGVRELASTFGLALPKDPGALADVAVAKVLANQQPDGGFGWWPDSRESSPWVTAYALWGLDVAKRGGRPVPDEAMSRAVQWLRGELGASPAYPWMRAAQAFAVDVLATIGKPDPGFANRLYEARDQMPLFARALLAHAFAMSKMDAKQAAELLRDLEAHVRLSPASAVVTDNLGDEYAPVLDSSARTTAMVLRALVAIDAKHPLAGRLARGLLAERDRGQWRSTQEAAWALLALGDYRKVAEKQAPDFDARVWVAGDLALDAPFRGRSLAVRDAHLAATKLLASPDAALAFQVQGKGDLFYEARLRYARKELPREGLDRGLFVRKTLRAVSPEGLSDALATLPAQSAARVPAGSLVLVDLVVVSPAPREQVVVDDPLAAGLEPVESSLETTARSLDVAREGGAGEAADEEDGDDDAIAAGRAWTQSTYHREMHDDRALTFVEHLPAGMFHYRYLARATTPGTYVVPPTKAECMYEPETFGRTAGSRLEVTAP